MIYKTDIFRAKLDSIIEERASKILEIQNKSEEQLRKLDESSEKYTSLVANVSKDIDKQKKVLQEQEDKIKVTIQ